MNTLAVGSPRDFQNGHAAQLEDEKQNVQTAEFQPTWSLHEINTTDLPQDEKVKVASQRVFVKLVDGEEKGRLIFDNDRRLVITLCGPPNSGKWTQSNKLEEILKLKGLFTKSLLADEMDNKDSPFGQLINFWLTKKVLDVTPEIVNGGLINHQVCQDDFLPGWIMGDYPLTDEQSKTYQRGFLKSTALHLPIYLNVSEEESLARNQAKEEDDREADDNLKSRLEGFKGQKEKFQTFFSNEVESITLPDLSNETESITLPEAVIPKRVTYVKDIDANQPEDQVFSKIFQCLEQKFDEMNQLQIQQQADREYLAQQPQKFAQLKKDNASLTSTNRLLLAGWTITAIVAGTYFYMKNKAE